jgi:hypothetical protein
MGNRVAEMHGVSASFGADVDVYRLRTIHRRLRHKAIASAKELGLSSRQAVVQFICDIGNEYLKETSCDAPPQRLLFSLRVLSPSYTPFAQLIPEPWNTWIAAAEKEFAATYEETQAFMPKLREARREAQIVLEQRLESLRSRAAPPELCEVWSKIPDSKQETERQIAKRTSLSLSEVVAWIEALQRSGVVTVIGTTLDEPKFWKTPISTLKEAERSLRTFLDMQHPSSA